MSFFKGHEKLLTGITIAAGFGVWAMWGEWKHADVVGWLCAIAMITTGYFLDRKEALSLERADEERLANQTKQISDNIARQLAQLADTLAPPARSEQIIEALGKTEREVTSAVTRKIKRAETALDSGQYNLAQKLYEDLCDLFPETSELLFNLGMSFLWQGDIQRALIQFLKTHQLDRKASGAAANAAHCYIEMGKIEDAILVCDNALKSSRSFALFINRSKALFLLGRYQETLASCEDALEINSTSWVALNNKGNALAALGKFEDSISAFDKALASDKEKYETLYNKACAFSLWRRKGDALESLSKAIELAPHKSMWAQIDPDFEHFRSDPDFRKLVGLN